MTKAAKIANSRVPLPCADLVSRWSDMHSHAGFIINEDELHCLHTIALNHRDDAIACLILRKLAKAELINAALMPPDVVSLNKIVEYKFFGQIARQRLLHPNASLSSTGLSVSSTVGAGLIGMAMGQAIKWPHNNGGLRDLIVVSVSQACDPIEPTSPKQFNGRA